MAAPKKDPKDLKTTEPFYFTLSINDVQAFGGREVIYEIIGKLKNREMPVDYRKIKQFINQQNK